MHVAQMDRADGLSETTRQWLDEATPATTARAYRWAWSRYTDWCTQHRREALPATSDTITEYVGHLRATGAAPSTIDQALGVILAHHKRAGLPRPMTDDARTMLRGYRRHLAENGITVRQAIPFTDDTLLATVTALDLSTDLGRRDQLLLALGYAMYARRSELAALTVDDIQDEPEGVVVTVRASKTDKQSRGREVALPSLPEPLVDPVRLLGAWRRDVVGSGPLLRRLDLPGCMAGGITGHGVNRAVRAAVRRAGLAEPDRYTAHSLRAGGLTAALWRGVPAGVAARHGGWEPESPTVLRYARVADRWRDNALSGSFGSGRRRG